MLNRYHLNVSPADLKDPQRISPYRRKKEARENREKRSPLKEKGHANRAP